MVAMLSYGHRQDSTYSFGVFTATLVFVIGAGCS